MDEGHFTSKKTVAKFLQCDFYWPSLFKDAHIFYRQFIKCQAAINIQKRNAMPLKSVIGLEIFDVWGIDFILPFLSS
ncbi:unnamed protein product [Spirodela intermedia]|uniref:Integrase zinc-binding domain-containing protein n=1 Tax=Spirodela intermedia TaxID=51605 RepID=A0A811G6I1_SPIIN|nr:unnamed protein product [Spirodela intermedia]